MSHAPAAPRDAVAAPKVGDGGRPLRLAMLVDVFPRPSNTFVIDQIGGLIARGHEVDIFARYPAEPPARSETLERYAMASRMRHLVVPHGQAARLLALLRALTDPGVWRPGLLAELAASVRHASLTRLFTSISFLRERPYDVVHAHFGTLGPLAASLQGSGALRGELVVAFRGADATRWVGRDPASFRATFERAALLLPVSASLRRRLLDAGAPPERCVVHHDGIAVSRFPFRERTAPLGGPVRTLFVGRLADKKGVRYALEAFAEVRTRHPNATFDVAGDGELRADLEARAADLGVGSSVRFLGLLSPTEVAETMQAAHLLVAPSVTADNGDQEGIPSVIKEAMATGLPVVSTLHSGIPELVRDGESGLLVPERDVPALAGAWADLLACPERWPAMGRAGRAAVEAGFDASRLDDDLVGHYRRVAAAASSRRSST